MLGGQLPCFCLQGTWHAHPSTAWLLKLWHHHSTAPVPAIDSAHNYLTQVLHAVRPVAALEETQGHTTADVTAESTPLHCWCRIDVCKTACHMPGVAQAAAAVMTTMMISLTCQ